MISYRDIVGALRDLGLGPETRAIAHVSTTALGPVAGGTETVVGALVATLGSLFTPTFTSRTMVVPEVGPDSNALDYGRPEQNERAEIYHAGLAADPDLGSFAEQLRRHPQSHRSDHPLLSMTGVNAESLLRLQTVESPWGPIEGLTHQGGMVLLIGARHRRNCTIHYAEAQAGRVQFVRWALTRQGVVECPGWPGCPEGFDAIASRVGSFSRSVRLGSSTIQAIPARDLVHAVVSWIHEDPRALLCDRLGCPRCSVVRASVRVGE